MSEVSLLIQVTALRQGGGKPNIRREAFLVVAALSERGIIFPDHGELLVHAEKARMDGRPILVAVTGTTQKSDKIFVVSKPGSPDSLVSAGEIFSRIDVDEISGSTGGEVVLYKAQDFAEKLLGKIKGADDSHRDAILENRLFLLCDTKMGMGQIGHRFHPVHKLRTEMTQQNVDITDHSRLISILPEWWASNLERIAVGHDLAVRWSTGDAVIKFLRDKISGRHQGKYVLGYADSKASVVLPHRLLSSVNFWETYLKFGLKKRNNDLSVHLGASMGILIEDIAEILVDEPKWEVSYEDLNILMPTVPGGVSKSDYLDQHAKGAPKDVIDAILGWIIKQKSPRTQWLGTREFAV